jgi:hypothetical protein
MNAAPPDRDLNRDPEGVLGFADLEYSLIYYMNPYPLSMRAPPMPPKLRHKGPTLDTLHMVESVVRKVDKPLSLNRIKRRLPRKMMHATLREAIDHYKRLGCVTEGSKGVMWTLNVGPDFWKVVEAWEAR